jgi:hypothetical protein
MTRRVLPAECRTCTICFDFNETQRLWEYPGSNDRQYTKTHIQLGIDRRTFLFIARRSMPAQQMSPSDTARGTSGNPAPREFFLVARNSYSEIWSNPILLILHVYVTLLLLSLALMYSRGLYLQSVVVTAKHLILFISR